MTYPRRCPYCLREPYVPIGDRDRFRHDQDIGLIELGEAVESGDAERVHACTMKLYALAVRVGLAGSK